VACVRTEPSVGKGLWTYRTQPGVGHGYRAHRTQSPGWSSQDATLLYLTQATFLLMIGSTLISNKFVTTHNIPARKNPGTLEMAVNGS